MAPVEGYYYKPETKDPQKKPIRVPRGSYKRIPFPSAKNRLADVFVHCDAIDSLGSVYVVTEREDISIVFFDGKTIDDEGLYLGNDNPVKFSGIESVEVIQMGNPDFRLRLSHYKIIGGKDNIAQFELETVLEKARRELPEEITTPRDRLLARPR